MNQKIFKFLFFIIFLVVIAESIFYIENYRKNENTIKNTEPIEVTLEFWGAWDNSDSWEKIIERFEEEKHVWNDREFKVKINYTKKDYASYEEDIQKKYSDGNSPTIFMINNYWLEKYSDKLSPLSGNIAIKKEYDLIDYSELTDIFPVYLLQDAEFGNNELFAMPIYSDSLALYYNKDLFEKAGVTSVPETWDDLKKTVKKITEFNRSYQIEQSAIAMGTGSNINRSCDILSLLILQSGGKIINDQEEIDINKKISFNTTQGIQDREPGINAIQFYMEFSDPSKEIYTWDKSFNNSIESFAKEETAMIFGYSYYKSNLLILNPDLNYGVAQMPQIPESTVVNISNTWFPVVSNQNSCKFSTQEETAVSCENIAWSFLSFANQKENISEYLKQTNKASARIDVSQEQSEEGDFVSVFAEQNTSARSYNKFSDEIDSILTEMLDNVSINRNTWKTEIDKAVEKIEELKK